MIIKVFVTKSLLELAFKTAIGFVIFLLNGLGPAIVSRWYNQEVTKPASLRNHLAGQMTDESVDRLRPSRAIMSLVIIYLAISAFTYYFDHGQAIDNPCIEINTIPDSTETENKVSEEYIQVDEPDPGWFAQYLLRMTMEEIPIAELEQFDSNSLSYLRNGIYALHGRMFKDEKYSTYFSQYKWYHASIPNGQFTDDCFNSSEKKNIANIVYIEDTRKLERSQ